MSQRRVRGPCVASDQREHNPNHANGFIFTGVNRGNWPTKRDFGGNIQKGSMGTEIRKGR